MKSAIIIAAAALLAGTGAQAQSYRSIGMSEGKVLFLEVGSDVRQEARADARMIANLGPGPAAYMSAEIGIDCMNNEYNFKRRAAHGEDGTVMGRMEEPTAMTFAPRGSPMDAMIDLICYGNMPEGSQVYPDAATAMAAARRMAGE